jgi:hypothetical protein
MRNIFWFAIIISQFIACNNADNKTRVTAETKDSLVSKRLALQNTDTANNLTQQPPDSALQYAYIKNVIKKADTVFIVADFIQYLTGTAALAEAKRNGDADTAYDDKGKITTVYVANDFYVLNSSKKLRQFPLAEMYIIETLSSTNLQKTSLKNFMKKYPFDNFIFKLEIKNGVVTKISEQYLP